MTGGRSRFRDIMRSCPLFGGGLVAPSHETTTNRARVLAPIAILDETGTEAIRISD